MSIPVRLLAAFTCLALASTTGGALAAPLPDTPLASSNVTPLGTIPEVGAVGGQVRTVNTLLGEKKYFVMTSARGVSAYDITVPEAPVLVSHLPLAHWENEDVDFSRNLLIISQDPEWFFAGLYGRPELSGGLYLIDISKLPALTFAYTNPLTGNRWTPPALSYVGHTTSCLDATCSFAIVNGSSKVPVVDLRNPADPKVVRVLDSGVGGTHDAQVDAAGLVWQVGGGGIEAYDVSVPTLPRRVVGPVKPSTLNRYLHNSFRPDAEQWVPRTLANFDDPAVFPGEAVFITEEEIYNQVACNRQGRFGAARVRDTDPLSSGAIPSFQMLDTWETELTIGGQFNASGVCSAHYFDEKDGIAAVTWFQEGTRFLDVSNPRDLRQIGYHINKTGVAVNVKWIGPGSAGGEILYVMDETRGIDILRFDRAPSAPTVSAPVLPEWRAATTPSTAVPHPTFGYACRLSLSR